MKQFLKTFKISVQCAFVVFIGFSCRKPDNTNRIRPATGQTKEADIGSNFEVYYNLKKDSSVWQFPAATFMRAQSSLYGNGNMYSYRIELDNSFKRNDTLFYDKLTLNLENVIPGYSYRNFNKGFNSTYAFYKIGNQYEFKEYSIPPVFEGKFKDYGFVEVVSQANKRTKLNVSITTEDQRHIFRGEIHFTVK